MKTLITRIIIQDIVVIIVKNMDMFLKIVLGHTSVVITNRWLIQTACFSYLKTGHINRYCPTKSKAPSCEFDKGKGKANVEHIGDEMNKK